MGVYDCANFARRRRTRLWIRGGLRARYCHHSGHPHEQRVESRPRAIQCSRPAAWRARSHDAWQNPIIRALASVTAPAALRVCSRGASRRGQQPSEPHSTMMTSLSVRRGRGVRALRRATCNRVHLHAPAGALPRRSDPSASIVVYSVDWTDRRDRERGDHNVILWLGRTRRMIGEMETR